MGYKCFSFTTSRKEKDKSPLKQKNVSPSKLDDSPVKAPVRKRARILESDEEEENVSTSPTVSETKHVAQRLEDVQEEKNAEKVGHMFSLYLTSTRSLQEVFISTSNSTAYVILYPMDIPLKHQHTREAF